MYEANNVEYLDCCNSSAHVGHCHPQVKILLVLSKQKKLSRFFMIILGGGQRPTADGEVDHSTGVHIREPEEICQGDTSLKHPVVIPYPSEPGHLSSGIPLRLFLHDLWSRGERPGDASCQTIHRGNRYHGGRGGAPRKYWHYARHQSKDAQQVRFFFFFASLS